MSVSKKLYAGIKMLLFFMISITFSMIGGHTVGATFSAISPLAVDYEEYDANSVIVYTFTGLKTVLSSSNSYTTIYLGSDITMTGGITIPVLKTRLTIDGTNPLDATTSIYTLTEVVSLSTGQTIGLESGSALQLTVQNLNIVGYNYYGTFYVPYNSSMSSVTIAYDNVTYSGPQMSYNPYGTCIYTDCNIQIITSNTAAQELAELGTVVFGGTITLNNTTTSDSIFWFRGSSARVTIQPNANVSITTQLDMCYSDAGAVDMVIGENATLTITVKNGLFRDNGHQASNFTIKEGANVTINHQNNNGIATINCAGTFSIADNATVLIQSPYRVLNFTTSTSAIQVTDPSSVILYSSSNNIFNFSSTTTFSLSSQQMNYWTSFLSLPTVGSSFPTTPYHYYKSDGSDIALTGTLTNSSTSNVTSNLTSDDDVALPSPLNLQTAKAFSMGSLPLTVDTMDDRRTEVTGTTMQGALVTASYSNGTSQNLTGNADGQGNYSITLPSSITAGTVVTVKSDYMLLTRTNNVAVMVGEYLAFGSVPVALPFGTIDIPSRRSFLPRLQTDWTLTVVDSRTNSPGWNLFASIVAPMKTTNGCTLTNALVFMDEHNTAYPLNGSLTKVFTGPPNISGVQTTPVTWADDQGILLQISPEEVVAGEEYSTIITWTLQDAL